MTERLTQEEALEVARGEGWTTFRWGSAQGTLMPLQAADEAYMLNWIVPPDQRGQGHSRRLYECVLWIADTEGWTLVAHADSPRLEAGARHAGFVVDSERDLWEGKPCMVRAPQQPGEAPEHLDKLVFLVT